MGNRVCISLTDGTKKAPSSLYLHWNGGRESTDAFFNAVFDFMKERRPDDLEYFHARFTQVIGNYLGGACSIGVIKNPNTRQSYGNDNPDVTYNINERAVYGIDNPDTMEKHNNIYSECLNYLYSTLSPYEATETSVVGFDAEIDRLTKLKAQSLERIEERKKAQKRRTEEALQAETLS